MYWLILFILACLFVWCGTREKGYKKSKPPKRVFDAEGYDQDGYDRDGGWKYNVNSDYMKKQRGEI